MVVVVELVLVVVVAVDVVVVVVLRLDVGTDVVLVLELVAVVDVVVIVDDEELTLDDGIMVVLELLCVLVLEVEVVVDPEITGSGSADESEPVAFPASLDPVDAGTDTIGKVNFIPEFRSVMVTFARPGATTRISPPALICTTSGLSTVHTTSCVISRVDKSE